MPETFIGHLNDRLAKRRDELKSNLHSSGKRIDLQAALPPDLENFSAHATPL